MRILVTILAACTIAGCSKDPISVSDTDNVGIQVAKLFTHNGVTVFRFNDAGRWVYFTSNSSDVTALHTETYGKGRTRTVRVETKGVCPSCRGEGR
ncbi:DUF4884 domain-containing protein [Bordetella trematum]|nr:DUF4884 domain-containing protein [Bordetella trematum]